MPGLCPGECARCIAGCDACPTHGWDFASKGPIRAFRQLCRIYSRAAEKAHTQPSLRRTVAPFTSERVDRVDFSGPGKIGTIGTSKLY